MDIANVIYDSSDKNADLYYASGFAAYDPFIYLERRGKKYLVLSDLEIDRGKKESKVDKVLPLSKYEEIAKSRGKNPKDILVILDLIFRDFKIKRISMPKSTGFDLVDRLRKSGYRVTPGPSPFYPQRLIKSAEEVRNIEAVQRAVFKAMRLAEDVLRKSSIKKNMLYYKGAILTSERMKELISVELLRHGCVATEGTIVACGDDTIDPHNTGRGPLRPHKSIIVDIFPKSQKTFFYGDATRTFCKGRAPKELKDLYKTVKDAQKLGLETVRAGLNGRSVHKRIMKLMEDRGYKTGEKDGRMQGFFHSTGHGIGLELHEGGMRIGPIDYKLKAGHVFSIEPGLYYKGIGGVRIEDLVLITERGCRVISGYPKRLEIL